MVLSLTLEEKEQVRSLIANERLLAAVVRAFEIDALGWKSRLLNEAMNPSTADPVARLTKQTEYAARAKQLEDNLIVLKKAMV